MLLCLFFHSAKFAFAEDKTLEGFYPTWKLLGINERQQFLAGYMFGLKDAGKVTDVMIGYVKENPAKALDGLEKIKAIYQVQSLNPADLVKEVDLFFQASENKQATLAQAISFARARLQ